MPESPALTHAFNLIKISKLLSAKNRFITLLLTSFFLLMIIKFIIFKWLYKTIPNHAFETNQPVIKFLTAVLATHSEKKV